MVGVIRIPLRRHEHPLALTIDRHRWEGKSPMPNDKISTSATTASVAGIVGPANTSFVPTAVEPVAYTVTAHPPTPHPARMDERVSLAPAEPLDALRALLRTRPNGDD